MPEHSAIRIIKTHHNVDESQGSHAEGRKPCIRVDTGWFHLYMSSRYTQSTVIMKKLFVMGGFTDLMLSWFPGKIHTVDPCTMRRAICRCSNPYIKWCRIKNTVCPKPLEISNHIRKIQFLIPVG